MAGSATVAAVPSRVMSAEARMSAASSTPRITQRPARLVILRTSPLTRSRRLTAKLCAEARTISIRGVASKDAAGCRGTACASRGPLQGPPASSTVQGSAGDRCPNAGPSFLQRKAGEDHTVLRSSWMIPVRLRPSFVWMSDRRYRASMPERRGHGAGGEEARTDAHAGSALRGQTADQSCTLATATDAGLSTSEPIV